MSWDPQPQPQKEPELHAGALVLCSTEALLDELQRRCLGCLVVGLKADGRNEEEWHWRVKGSPALIGAMSAKLNAAIRDTEGEG